MRALFVKIKQWKYTQNFFFFTMDRRASERSDLLLLCCYKNLPMQFYHGSRLSLSGLCLRSCSFSLDTCFKSASYQISVQIQLSLFQLSHRVIKISVVFFPTLSICNNIFHLQEFNLDIVHTKEHAILHFQENNVL